MRKSNYLWLLLVAVLLLPAQEMAAKKKKEKEVTDRELWAGVLYQMAAPVLSNMSEGKLQKNMQVELSPTWDGRDKTGDLYGMFRPSDGGVGALALFAGR